MTDNKALGHHSPSLFQQALPLPALHALQNVAHLPNKENLSFWVDWADVNCPEHGRTLVEQVVHYLCSAICPPEKSKQLAGIEWWLHKRDAAEYMKMHFDKDEGSWADRSVLRHPLMSSVFYITNAGGPTLVVNQTCSTDMLTLIPERAENGWRCPVQANQFFLFPGSLLHGVLPGAPEFKRVGDEFVEVQPEECVGRVTLMINFWEHPLNDRTCVPLQRTEAAYQRYGRALDEKTWGGPNPVFRSVDIKTIAVGPEIRDMYFYEHDPLLMAEYKEKLKEEQSEDLDLECDVA